MRINGEGIIIVQGVDHNNREELIVCPRRTPNNQRFTQTLVHSAQQEANRGVRRTDRRHHLGVVLQT